MPTEDTYEFHERENTVFARLAAAMTFVGLAMLIPGALFGVAAMFFRSTLVGGGVFGVLALLFVAMGVLEYRAAGHFRRIAKTQGHDVENLMIALDELAGVYDIERWLWIVVGAVVLIALVGTQTGYSP